VPNWALIYGQLSIKFGDRVKEPLAWFTPAK
jgi:hypothetical protein